MNTVHEKIYLSLVIPVYKGEQYLPQLVNTIKKERTKWLNLNVRIEITEAIFVLDNPVDRSKVVLEALAQDHSWIRVVELSRNYGQHSATVAGILYSSGDWVVTLDEDMQHDPRLIVDLLQKASSENADIVFCVSQKSVHGGGYRDKFSRWIKKLISGVSGNKAITIFNSFRLIRGDIARAASSICAQHTYFDIALTWYTERISSLEIDLKDYRYASNKQSGYKFWMLVNHAKRMIMTSDFKILRVTTTLALAAVTISIIFGAQILYYKFFSGLDYVVQGWASLMLVILMFGGLSILILGMIIEFLHVLMLQLQGKPTFFIIKRNKDDLLQTELKKLFNHADSAQ